MTIRRMGVAQQLNLAAEPVHVPEPVPTLAGSVRCSDWLGWLCRYSSRYLMLLAYRREVGLSELSYVLVVVLSRLPPERLADSASLRV